MALFKIHKGSANNLGKTGNITQYTQEGYAYFTTEDGKFYIDIAGDGTTPVQLGVNRLPLNAYKADRDEDGNRIATNYIKRTKETKQTISVTGGGTTLRLNSFNKHGSLIEFSNTQSSTNESGETVETQVSLGYLGVWDGSPCYYYNDSSYNILHAGNYSDYALPLSGGTLTGSLSVNGGVQAGSVWGKQTSAEATVGVENNTLNSNLYLYANKSKLGLYCTIGSDISKNIISIDSAGITNFIGNASTATKATQDGNGNVIASTYLPLSGGTLTGPLSLGNTNWILQDFYTGESSITSRQYGKAHAIQLGIPGRDYMNFYEFGGVFNFYKTNDIYNDPDSISDGILIAQITPDGFIGNLNGNAATATKLATARNFSIGNAYCSFDGSADVNLDTTNIFSSYSTGTLNISWDDLYTGFTTMYGSNDYNWSGTNCPPGGFYKWGGTFTLKSPSNNGGFAQLYFAHTASDGHGILYRSGWGVDRKSWATILDSNNYTSYCAPAGHTHSYLPLAGGTITGNLSLSAAASGTSPMEQRISINGVAGSVTVADAPGIGFHTGNVGWATIKCVGSSFYFYDSACTGYVPIYGSQVYGAVWNDYAEYRSQNEAIEPGYITYCDDDGKLKKTTERLQKYEGIVSDTFGFAIGETDDCKTPLAVSGRALVYCDPEEEHFHSGDCVCAGPDGLAYRMTREEVMEFPDRIVGVVSEIPTYETWGTGNVAVNGRIWVKVK